MARKLFEFRATRARSGGLALGIEYVVWDDEAATVLADISTSSGGSSIAGSTVTTADIAGLGPSACRFYGPSDDQDTLWVTCPSDPTLGVQRVEAATDARLDLLEAGVTSGLAAHEADTTVIHGIADTAQVALRNATNTFTLANKFQANVLIKGPYPVINPLAYGTFTSGADINAAMASALTDSATIAADRFATIELPPGDWGVHELDWSGATTRLPLIKGAEVGSTRVFYNGAGGAGTYMFRNHGSSGGATPWGGFQNIMLDCNAGGGVRAESAYKVTGDGVDWAFKLENFWAINATGDAIDFGPGVVVNLFMRRLRFDGNAGWAIRLRGTNSGEHRPILLSEFTIDNTTSGGVSAGKGLMRVDDGQGYYIAIQHGRLEGNTNLVTESSGKQWILSNDTTGAGPMFDLKRLLGFAQAADSAVLLRDLTGSTEAKFDSCNLTDCALFKDDTDATRNIATVSPQDLGLRGTDAFSIRLNSAAGLQLQDTASAFPKIQFFNTTGVLEARFLSSDNGTTFHEFGLGSGGPLTWRGGPSFTPVLELTIDGDLKLQQAGHGLHVKEGSNAKMGVATLVAGVATVLTTAVTASSRIFLTSQVDGGTNGFLRVTAKTAGTSFVISSSNAADTSTVAWLIFEPS